MAICRLGMLFGSTGSCHTLQFTHGVEFGLSVLFTILTKSSCTAQGRQRRSMSAIAAVISENKFHYLLPENGFRQLKSTFVWNSTSLPKNVNNISLYFVTVSQSILVTSLSSTHQSFFLLLHLRTHICWITKVNPIRNGRVTHILLRKSNGLNTRACSVYAQLNLCTFCIWFLTRL